MTYKEKQRKGQEESKVLKRDYEPLMNAFGEMYKEAYKDNALSSKMKSLIGIAVSVAIQCDGCAYHHVEKAIQLEATREEVIEAIGMAVLMGGGPSTHYGSSVLSVYDEFINN